MRFVASAVLLFALCALSASLAGCDGSGPSPPSEPPPEPPALSSDEWTYLGLGGEDIANITALVVHPEKPNVIYAGSNSDFSAQIPGKLFKTTDYGRTWDTLRTGGSYRDIQIDPQDPDVVYALPGGVIKSTDGGETWEDLSEDLGVPTIDKTAQSLAIDPEDPEVLYVGLGGFLGGLPYKSIDGGESWKKIEGSRNLNDITSLAIDPDDPETVYAGIDGTGRIYESADGGETWQIDLKNENGSVHFIRFSPFNGSAYTSVYGNSFYRLERNGRAPWVKESTPDSAGIPTAISFGPAGERYLATIEGIYRWPSGSEWAALNEGLPLHRRVETVAVGPTEKRIYAGMSRTYVGADEHGLYARRLPE